MLMAITYTQSPLFSSNQHQYFLHGMAQAGLGSLKEDWLAGTVEPTPLFTLLVEWVLRLLQQPLWFYGIYALLMGLYLCSLLGILDFVFSIRSSRIKLIITVTLILAAHSALLRYVLGALFGANWMFLLDGGVAGQRLLGTVLQPSAFGVLLILSLYLFVAEKPIWASVTAALAACVHPTYLLSAGLLVAGYMLQSGYIEKNLRRAMAVGLSGLVVVMPMLWYVFSNFWVSEGAEKARTILAEIRIPHHALANVWFDVTSLIKIFLVIAGLLLVRNHKKLFTPLCVIFCFSVALSLYQVYRDDLFLALIFPWRPSALLVPIASSLVLANIGTWINERIARANPKWERCIAYSCTVTILLLCLGGLLGMVQANEAAQQMDQNKMQDWVRTNSKYGDSYLIPVDLETFRTATLRPIYVDFFSIPYSNKDVIKWYHRLLSANKFYDTGECRELFHIQHDAGINHVVMRKNDKQPKCEGMRVVHKDSDFIIYKLTRIIKF